MKEFQTLEEAILKMAQLTGRKNYRTGEDASKIKLAKWDMNPVRKFADQIKEKGLGFTPAQKVFVTKLINKYTSMTAAVRLSEYPRC